MKHVLLMKYLDCVKFLEITKVELKSNHGFLSFRVLTKCNRTLPEADIITLSSSRFRSKCQSHSCFENICVNAF